ncbi:MAG: hypothetical protein J6L71_05635 [Clostridia bacterium]|nr:hypothetical protein [Clostridia bacterium]
MKEDFIIDALENIDDDMLEDVDRLRERRNAKPKHLWMKYVSAAACICFVLTGVFFASRDESPSRYGTEDTTDPTEMSGQGFIHNYIRAEVSLSYSGSTPRVITEPRDVTALFDVLELIVNTEEEVSLTNKGSHGDDSESERNLTPPGSAPATVGSATYTIVLTSFDGNKVRYALEGDVLTAEDSGKSYRLSREHYYALAELINLK